MLGKLSLTWRQYWFSFPVFEFLSVKLSPSTICFCSPSAVSTFYFHLPAWMDFEPPRPYHSILLRRLT